MIKIVEAPVSSEIFSTFAKLNFNAEDETQAAQYSILQQLSPTREFFKHGEGQAFVLIENDKPVGRIYACIDQLLNPADKEKRIGMFGYIVCQDQIEHTQMLIETAAEWLKKRGCSEMHGPINLNIYNGYRLQTAGFKTLPFLGEPRTPAYLAQHLEKLGMSSYARWNSWEVPIWRLHFNGIRLKIKMFFDGKKKYRGEYKVVPFDLNNIEAHFEQIYELFMKTFKKNYFFTHVSYPEFKEYFLDMSKLLDPSSPLILDTNNKAIGFAFNFANPSQMNGKRVLIMHTVCIAESYRKKGVMDSMGIFVDRQTRGRFDYIIGALAKEGRTVYDRAGAPSRSYAVYCLKFGSKI